MMSVEIPDDHLEAAAQRTLGLLPDPIAQVFAELVSEDLLEVAQLRQLVDDHLAAIEAKAGDGAYVDDELARLISSAVHTLLGDLEEPGNENARVIQALCLYFVRDEDAEPDTDSMRGFDDDIKVLNAVVEAVDRPELWSGQPS